MSFLQDLSASVTALTQAVVQGAQDVRTIENATRSPAAPTAPATANQNVVMSVTPPRDWKKFAVIGAVVLFVIVGVRLLLRK